MISWAAISSSTKLALLVKVGAEAEVDGLAVVADVAVMAEAVVVEVAEAEVVVAVAAEEAAVAVTAVIAAVGVAATVAGNRLLTIKICNETGEPARADSPVLFCANLFVVKIHALFYAFP